MKPALKLSAFLILWALVLPAAPAEEAPPIDESLFKSRSVGRHPGSSVVMKGKLKKPATIQGMPCMRWVWFHPSGKLDMFQAAEAIKLQDIQIPAKSFVFLREDGTVDHVWFSKDVVIEGVPCNGGWGKIDTKFHPNGRLKLTFLSESRVLQGVPCKASLFRPVEFDDGGKLIRATLTRGHVIGGESFKKGDEIVFDTERRARLSKRESN